MSLDLINVPDSAPFTRMFLLEDAFFEDPFARTVQLGALINSIPSAIAEEINLNAKSEAAKEKAHRGILNPELDILKEILIREIIIIGYELGFENYSDFGPKVTLYLQSKNLLSANVRIHHARAFVDEMLAIGAGIKEFDPNL